MLAHFQQRLEAPYAMQVVIDMPYVQADCFGGVNEPIVVPAATFLSQLL